MRDPLDEHYSPAPPSGFRARLARRRGTLIGAGVVVGLVAAIVVGAVALSGDGKGSGDIERAFGRLSQEDEIAFADVLAHQAAVRESLFRMVETSAKGHIAPATEAGEEGLRSLASADAIVDRIENGVLRESLREIGVARTDVFEKYLDLLAYVRAHKREVKSGRGRAKTRDLIAEIDAADREMARAENAMMRRLRPYLNAQQLSEFRRVRQETAERVAAIGK